MSSFSTWFCHRISLHFHSSIYIYHLDYFKIKFEKKKKKHKLEDMKKTISFPSSITSVVLQIIFLYSLRGIASENGVNWSPLTDKVDKTIAQKMRKTIVNDVIKDDNVTIVNSLKERSSHEERCAPIQLR